MHWHWRWRDVNGGKGRGKRNACPGGGIVLFPGAGTRGLFSIDCLAGLVGFILAAGGAILLFCWVWGSISPSTPLPMRVPSRLGFELRPRIVKSQPSTSAALCLPARVGEYILIQRKNQNTLSLRCGQNVGQSDPNYISWGGGRGGGSMDLAAITVPDKVIGRG